MKLVLPVMLVLLAVAMIGCEKQRTAQAPVRFDVAGLVIEPDAQNTNAMKISGTLRVRGDALKDKVVLLHLGGEVSFKRSGLAKPFFAHNDQVLVTNGVGPVELWFFVSPAERAAVSAEISTASYVFESEGYAELKPAVLEVP